MVTEIQNIKFFISIELRKLRAEMKLRNLSASRLTELKRLEADLLKSKSTAINFFNEKERKKRNNQWNSLISELTSEKTLGQIGKAEEAPILSILEIQNQAYKRKRPKNKK